MAVLRAIARPMLAAVFIVQGYDTMRHPEKVAQRAELVVRPLRERVPILPAETEDTVRLNGAVQVVAGSMLALGWWPRLSALTALGQYYQYEVKLTLEAGEQHVAIAVRDEATTTTSFIARTLKP